MPKTLVEPAFMALTADLDVLAFLLSPKIDLQTAPDGGIHFR